MGQFSVTIYGATGSVLSDIQHQNNALKKLSRSKALNLKGKVAALVRDSLETDIDSRILSEMLREVDRSVEDLAKKFERVFEFIVICKIVDAYEDVIEIIK